MEQNPDQTSRHESRVEMAPTTKAKAASGVRETGGVMQGPWDEAFWVDLPMPLKSKSNFRRGSKAQNNEWASQRRFSNDVAALVRRQIPRSWQVGSPDEPVSGRPAVIAIVVARSLIDAGNFSKSVLDACEGLVFHNDASVVHSGSFAERGRKDQRSVVGFARVPAGSSLKEIVVATNQLAEHLVEAYAE